MYVVWSIWGAAFLVSLTVLEGYTLITRQLTLTTYVRNVTSTHPILEPIIIGVLVFLVVHFWWQQVKA